MWDDLVRGALGAVILVDTRRLEDCFPAIGGTAAPYVHHRVNSSKPASLPHRVELAAAPPDVPIVTTDARAGSGAETLISLVKHAMVVEERRSRQLVH